MTTIEIPDGNDRVIRLKMRGPVRSWLWSRWHRLRHRRVGALMTPAEAERLKAAIMESLKELPDART